MYDIIIIGSGPAGMTAAIYGARSNLKVAIIERSAPGGTVVNTSVIENYPGYASVDGASLSMAMFEHMLKYPVEFIGDEVVSITKDQYFNVKVSNKTLTAKTVIIATGTKHKKLNIPGEDKFSGKGVSWCAICDGSLYKDKTVAVVGGGNSAFKEAIYLANLAKKVYLIHRRDEFRADQVLVEEVKQKSNIELVLSTTIKQFIGDTKLGKIEVVNVQTNEENTLEVDGVFEYVGQTPNNELVKDFGVVNDKGYIDVNLEYETKIKGLFACGDIVEKEIRQIVTATNDGAIAAVSASKYCR